MIQPPGKKRFFSKAGACPACCRKGGAVRILLMFFLTTVFLAQAAAAAPPIDDGKIRSAIQRCVAAKSAVPAESVEIQVNDGVVMLSGSTANLLQKSRITRIAESIRGVRAVIDNTRVVPALREDDAVARDVRAALARSASLGIGEITVAVENGVVTLQGTVDSWVRSRLSERRAMSVRGATKIVNQISVIPGRHRDDKTIQMDVIKRLQADLYVDASSIDVAVTNGRVRLEGSVRTAAEKRRAAENAWVAGVIAVEDRQLTAKWPQKKRVQRPSPYIQQSDRAILRAVEDALLMDPRVNAANPNVSVINGVVTLSGVVDTLYAKRAAEADALNTTGVWKVDNQLQLRYRAFPPDGEVESMIRDVFRRDAELYALDLEVNVTDNHVILSGSVDTLGQKVRAENIASQLEGVLTLENRIHVTPDEETASDSDIADAIEEELFWSPYVDSDRINVSVSDGRALLKGQVANRFVGRIAVQNAFEGGAQTVQTQLALNGGGIFAERFLEKPASAGLDTALELWR